MILVLFSKVDPAIDRQLLDEEPVATGRHAIKKTELDHGN